MLDIVQGRFMGMNVLPNARVPDQFRNSQSLPRLIILLLDQHAVAVREEPIALFDSVTVSRESEVTASEGTHQH